MKKQKHIFYEIFMGVFIKYKRTNWKTTKLKIIKLSGQKVNI